MPHSKKDSFQSIFDSNNLKNKYLKDLIERFWYSPCDGYLRAPEIAIWKSIKSKHPILDIGCSDGGIDWYLFRHMKLDVGLDPDEKLLDKAKKSGVYKKVVASGAEKMPFRDKSFATVVSNSTFEHIPNDLDSVKEVSRILKKEGDFIFTTTTERFVKTMNGFGVVGGDFKKYNKRVDHYHYRSLNKWKQILKENNLDIIYHRYYFPYPSMKTWWFLHRLTTLKVYRRELWSYLRDSPIKSFIPDKILSNVYFLLFKYSYKKAFDAGGNWIFIWAKKIK